MRSQSVIAITFVVALTLLSGCNSADPDAPLSQPGGNASTPPAVEDVSPPVVEDAEPPAVADAASARALKPLGSHPAAPAAVATEPEVVPSDSSEPAEEDMERVKADVGVAKAGRSLDEYEGVYVTPAKALFTVREKAVFQIQIPHGLSMYKATNGNFPRSHEEFMTHIIEAGQIQLPELPPGQRYLYDPEKGELMVEKPRMR